MKKIIRSPVMWIAFLVVLLVVIMYTLGFRITYSPELENNWDAISACAGWAAVFVAGIGSVVSVYFAIQVPKKIAEEQNRISLFEKRFEVYKVLTDCFAFAYMLEKTDIPDNKCREVFHVTFNDNAKLDHEITWLEQMRTYSDVQNKLKMAEHLFGLEIGEEVALLLADLLLLIQTEKDLANEKKRQLVFIEQSNKVEKECVPKIKELLSLK